jgi:hypothetical protein
LGNPRNVAGQNTLFKVSAGSQNRIKVFLDVPRIQPTQDNDIFDDVVQNFDDWNLSTRPMKILPHFDANTILLYIKANKDVSKFLPTIKSKEQCEQLRALLALDIRYLNGCYYHLTPIQSRWASNVLL